MLNKFLLLIFLSSTNLFLSQTKGVVLDDSDGEPILGAKIIASDGQKTITNILGEFIILKPTYPSTLIVSMFGFLSDTISISKDALLRINLKKQVLEVSTVVVTASRRNQNIEDVPISMEIIRPELINNKGLANLEQVVDQSPGVYAMDGQVSIRGG